LNADEVKEFNAYLQSVTISQLKHNYNSEKMNKLEIYPRGYLAVEDDNGNCLDYLLWHYKELKRFIYGAAKEKKAVLITIG
jgi:hypothetical protein